MVATYNSQRVSIPDSAQQNPREWGNWVADVNRYVTREKT